jgi:iron complex transport system substrate-binding protein
LSDIRIVSLIASATEIVCALGLQDSLVGRSHECDYPDTVKLLPQCTAPKFRTSGTSREIDRQVKAVVQEALSVYLVDSDKLRDLAPTHIITQSQCEVCAVSLRDVEIAVCKLVESRPVLVSLQPDSLSDVWDDIYRVGAALSAAGQAEELVARLRASMGEIAAAAREIERRPRVACIEWIDPLMSTGNWMPELVEMAGGVNLFGESGKHSPWMEWQDLVAADPDLIVITPCGFDIPRTLEETDLLTRRREWSDMKAVRTGRVFVGDGNQFFNRPGPRLLETVEILAELFHPGRFQFGHEGSGWVRL